MKELLSVLILVITIGGLALVSLISLGIIKPRVFASFFHQKSTSRPKAQEDLPTVMESPKTRCMNFWNLEQLDRNGEVIHTVPIYDVPEEGLMIGVDRGCPIRLKMEGTSSTVGRFHAMICEDDYGYYLVDNHSRNGIYNLKHQRIHQVDLTDGLEIYLADVRIRFSAHNPFQESQKTVAYPQKTVAANAYQRIIHQNSMNGF